MTAPLVEARNLVKHFPLPRRRLWEPRSIVHAVDDVSFAVMPGETFGLVGESGCGKTTVGKLLLYLEPITAGDLTIAGHRVADMRQSDERAFRRDVQAVFQDPYGSLNPRQRVLDVIGEPIQVQERLPARAVRERVRELLAHVGLPAGAENLYPHEFSGGQRQRIAIARAISVRPRFIVLDEAVSALDVSIRAQVLNLLRDLQEEFDLTYLFIAHDLSVVEFMSDRIAVMYLGKIVETGTAADIYRSARHPYTQALLRAATSTTRPGSADDGLAIEGEVPSPINPPSGCRFRTRCPFAKPLCAEAEPQVATLSGTHAVACHFHSEINAA